MTTIPRSLARSLIRGGIVFVLRVVVFALYHGTAEAMLAPGRLEWPLSIGLVAAVWFASQ
jgi:uncharacterized integral membrane protein